MNYLRPLLNLLVAILLLIPMVAASQSLEVTGRIVDDANEPIAYATVVLLKGQDQVAGQASDDQGRFSLKAQPGSYTLMVACIGYKSLEQQVELSKGLNLGDLQIEESTTEIEQVVVKARLIRREADRFVLDVSNSTIAVGRDAAEVLKVAPGVWVGEEEISLNGNSGTKFYLNEREVKMSDEELVNYLRSIPAEDIQRIDVIPQSGAEYDASSRGGIIKITTKQRTESGLMGNARLRVSGRPDTYNVRPSLSLDYNSKRVNIYGRLWSRVSEGLNETTEQTHYQEGTTIGSNATDRNFNYSLGGNIGIIYDINNRHSIGAEYNIYSFDSDLNNNSQTEYRANNLHYRSQGDYHQEMGTTQGTATLNYIYKLDNDGSVFKILADYTHSGSPSKNLYHDQTLPVAGMQLRDSLYGTNSKSRYHLATATADLEKVFSKKVQLRAGVKYTFNKNSSSSLHEWLAAPNLWELNPDHSYQIAYTENIGAAYISATAKLGRWSLVGGLRGEYTRFRSADGLVKQNYFDLFPNANISYALSKDYSYSIIAQYARTIRRPGFWELSPYESKSSEFIIMRGNPNLKATYNNSVSLTTILKYKYSITVGVNIMDNAIEPITTRDEHNPNLLIIRQANLPTVTNYFANVNIPIDITKWWSANLSLMGSYKGQRFNDTDPVKRNFSGMGNLTLSFILPKSFFIDIDGYYMSGTSYGNMESSGIGDVNISLKRQMLKKRLTLTLGLNNLISPKMKTTNNDSGFTRIAEMHTSYMMRSVTFSAAYRFNSGKKFNARSVESGSAEDQMRLGSGGGANSN